MAAAAEQRTQSVRIHETPHELRIDVELPAGEPQLLLSVQPGCLEIRVFRPLEPELPWHSNPDATPT